MQLGSRLAVFSELCGLKPFLGKRLSISHNFFNIL